jgi:hypothetical protein
VLYYRYKEKNKRRDFYMNNGSFAFGIFLIFFFVLFFIIRKTSKRRDYDERQIAIRGEAYKAAYLVFLVLVIVNGLVFVFLGKSIADPYVTAVVGMCVSLIVFVFKCLAKDAYIGVKMNAKRYVVIISIIGALNIITAVINKNIISFSGNGCFLSISISFIIGVTFILIVAGIIWRLNENDGDEK